jgi:hypothetical protein
MEMNTLVSQSPYCMCYNRLPRVPGHLDIREVGVHEDGPVNQTIHLEARTVVYLNNVFQLPIQ